MKPQTLAIERVFSIPIREVSGLCIHRPTTGAPRLVAIGDATMELAWASMSPGREPTWDVADLAELGLEVAGPGRGSQFEAIATDARGLVLILREYPAVVHLIDPQERRLVVTIELMVRDGDGLRSPGERSSASLGEAMLPLRGSRLLVAKEKDPAMLIEFGPLGEKANGVDTSRYLGPEGAWAIPSRATPQLQALASWPLARDIERHFRDISDAAVGPDGRVYLLSDQSSRIVRLPASLPPSGEPLTVEATWKIEGKPAKAEGLEILPDGRAIVAIDEKEGKRNLLLLSPPIAELD